MVMSAAFRDQMWALLTPRFGLVNRAGEVVSEWVTADRGAVVRITYRGPLAEVAIAVTCDEEGQFWSPMTLWHWMGDGDQLEDRIDIGG